VSAKIFLLSACLASSLFFAGCGGTNHQKVLTVQASSSPHKEILEFIQEEMEKEGFSLRIVTVDDYNIPNRALAENEIDANFFQHKPFLDEQSKQFGYQLEPLSEVHIEPMGIYVKTGSWDAIFQGGVITIPSDPTNEGRALALLAKAGIISLKEGVLYPTVLDIIDNPYRCTFKEVDAAFISRTWEEVAAAVIPTNYALMAGLLPQKSALLLEDGTSAYVNVVTIRKGEAEREDLVLLKKHLESEKTKKYIETTYQGAVVPIH
jgi:D-methionine transport system substrate-binding protein